MKLHVLLLAVPALAEFAKKGCYPKLALLGATSQGSYQYQLNGWCTDQCKGLAVAALIGGDTCYCGDSLPLGSSVLNLNCDSECQGYPLDNCGGSNYFYVLVDSLVKAALAKDDSLTQQLTAQAVTLTKLTTKALTFTTDDTTTQTSAVTPSTLETSTSTSSTSSTTSLSSTSSTSSSEPMLTPVTTVVSTITTDGSEKALIIYKTIYNAGQTSASSSTPTALALALTTATPQKKLGISGGAIAGAVVGSVLGVALLAAAIFGFIWYRRKHDDDDLDFEDQFTLLGPEKPVAPPHPTGPNPFLTAGGYTFADQNTQAGGANTTNLLDSLNNHSRTTSHGFVLVGDHLLTLDADFHAYDDRQLRMNLPEPVLTRKISNGLLPDMVARQPGSLKVVNN